MTPPAAPPRTGYDYLDRVLDTPGAVLALAHRGGAYHPGLEGLENTVAAFSHAVALGYDYLETDVHVTRDGVLLAFHDAVLDRVTDRRGAIAELTYADVRGALIGGREAVPTLVELLDAFPAARFNIDLKSTGSAEALAALLAERGDEQRVLVGSFSPRRTALFRRLTGGRVATAATPLEIVAFRFLPAWAAARVARCAALQLPHRLPRGRRRLRLVTPGLVRRAHRAGRHVHVWTIDRPEEMVELLDRGVDGLFTDRTDILKDVLVSRGQWRESS